MRVVRSGKAVEGQITGVFDDGSDRLFTIYYEDENIPFQAQITARWNAYARKWKAGDSVSLVLKSPAAKGSQKFVLYPSSAYEVVGGRF